MAKLKLTALKREESGTAASRRLRRTGLVPGICYGREGEPIPVQIDVKEFHRVGHVWLSENMILELKVIDGEHSATKQVMIRELQYDPVQGDLLHVDFNELASGQKITARVSIVKTGEPKGVTQQGGIMESIMREVEITCFPSDLPERIEMDVSHLEIGHLLYVKDISLGDKVTILSDPGLPVFSVSAPRVEEEEAPAEEAPAVEEPEVIRKKEEGPEEKEET